MKSRVFVFLIGLCGLSVSTQAQEKIAKFFPVAAVPIGGEENLHKLLKGYLTPIGEDFGSLSNNGWYTTAATHSRWGFDLSVSVNNITTNSASKTFAPVTLTGVEYLGGNEPLQTVYGKEGVHPLFQYTEGNNNGTFQGADGSDPGKALPIGSFAIPTLQLGVGVLKGTDVYIRYTPTIKVQDTELGNWGIGVKHDIKQHFAAIAELPFSLSVFAGYTSLKATTDLSGYYTGDNQEGVAQTNSYTIQVLVGKQIKVLSLYAGIGYNSSRTNFDINGSYFVDRTDDGSMLNAPVTLDDPYSDSFSKSSIRATAGLRLKFGPVILNGDYTMLSKQSILSVGFGLTFDKKEI